MGALNGKRLWDFPPKIGVFRGALLEKKNVRGQMEKLFFLKDGWKKIFFFSHGA